ncbi:neutral zinc metallopeptidase [Actinopolyspora sp. H202]|uniref:neutral zinc metallopeptidase n=1 Tax=Actinopolyspora sp. H202 TaxID=1500456 RepID=UPI003EE724A7
MTEQVDHASMTPPQRPQSPHDPDVPVNHYGIDRRRSDSRSAYGAGDGVGAVAVLVAVLSGVVVLLLSSSGLLPSFGTGVVEHENERHGDGGFGTGSVTSSPVTIAEPTTDGYPAPEHALEESGRPHGTTKSGESERDTSGKSPRPVTSLGAHPFNIPGNGAIDTECDLPDFDTDTAAQRAFLRSLTPCLMAMWTPALREANLPVETPDVVVTRGDVHSPCGDRSWRRTAMYCGGNHTIYWTARHYYRIEGRETAGPYLGQFAHEFGHSLQGMTGISEAYGTAVEEAGGTETAEGLELSRRNELQATCYGGQALAALQHGGVDNDHIMSALRDASNRGDQAGEVRNHGSTAHNRLWAHRGFRTNRITECNTWSAADSEVS